MLRLAFFALLLLLILIGTAAAQGSRWRDRLIDIGLGLGTTRIHVSHEGHDREALVHLPLSTDFSATLPLVIVLHGGWMDGGQMMRMTGFNTIADREGFVVTYPDALENHWNDGRSTVEKHINDVGFLRELVQEIGEDTPIDPRRVFVTGISNGGIMSFRMACEASDLIAAAAPVCGSLPIEFKDTCKPTRATALLAINGTADRYVPYDGGKMPLGPGGTLLPVEETVRRWAGPNGCDPKPTTGPVIDNVPTDGTSYQVLSWTNASGDARVQLYRIIGGGHRWPGSRLRVFQDLTGTQSQEVDASEVIWAFFKAHPKR